MNKNIVVSFIITGTIFMLNTLQTFAQTPTATPTPVCQTVYGGGANCKATGVLIINKAVENPQTNTFSNNLLQDAYVFGTSETVTFQLSITNSTNGDISNIHILDTLPANLDYVASDGSFNETNRTVTLKADKLTAKSSINFVLKTKVNTQPLPNNQSVVCLTNTAQVQTTSFFFFNHTQSQDASIFCIKNSPGSTSLPTDTNSGQSGSTQPTYPQTPPSQTKEGKPVYRAPNSPQTPATGPEPLSLLLLPAFAFIGTKLRRVTKIA